LEAEFRDLCCIRIRFGRLDLIDDHDDCCWMVKW